MAKNSDDALRIYFRDGMTWENEVVKKSKRSSALAWTVTSAMIAITTLSVGAVASLVPLKSFEPYMVMVDKSSGVTEMKTLRDTDYESMSVTAKRAVTQANVVRYIRMREGYDPYQIEDNFGIAALLSTAEASRDLQDLYSATNLKNPTKIYGRNKKVIVDVKSVTFPNDSTALVRFSTEEKSDTDTAVRHFIGVVRYRYTSEPETNAWRFENPLGFQVYNYRRDQETVTGKE